MMISVGTLTEIPFSVLKNKIPFSVSQNIPRNFVQAHGNALRNKQVCLKVSGGAEWNLRLTKSKGQIWFQNGWQDFVEFYSVKLGYFMIFRYEKNSCFHAVIFYHSASEIQYPIKEKKVMFKTCLLYTSPSPRDGLLSRMPSSA